MKLTSNFVSNFLVGDSPKVPAYYDKCRYPQKLARWRYQDHPFAIIALKNEGEEIDEVYFTRVAAHIRQPALALVLAESAQDKVLNFYTSVIENEVLACVHHISVSFQEAIFPPINTKVGRKFVELLERTLSPQDARLAYNLIHLYSFMGYFNDITGNQLLLGGQKSKEMLSLLMNASKGGRDDVVGRVIECLRTPLSFYSCANRKEYPINGMSKMLFDFLLQQSYYFLCKSGYSFESKKAWTDYLLGVLNGKSKEIVPGMRDSLLNGVISGTSAVYGKSCPLWGRLLKHILKKIINEEGYIDYIKNPKDFGSLLSIAMPQIIDEDGASVVAHKIIDSYLPRQPAVLSYKRDFSRTPYESKRRLEIDLELLIYLLANLKTQEEKIKILLEISEREFENARRCNEAFYNFGYRISGQFLALHVMLQLGDKFLTTDKTLKKHWAGLYDDDPRSKWKLTDEGRKVAIEIIAKEIAFEHDTRANYEEYFNTRFSLLCNDTDWVINKEKCEVLLELFEEVARKIRVKSAKEEINRELQIWRKKIKAKANS